MSQQQFSSKEPAAPAAEMDLRYFVGCNNLGSFPFPDYDTHYPEAKWYALPGPCESKSFEAPGWS